MNDEAVINVRINSYLSSHSLMKSSENSGAISNDLMILWLLTFTKLALHFINKPDTELSESYLIRKFP